MTTCHICGRVAAFTDSATGDPLCALHANHRYRKAPLKPAITMDEEWRKLRYVLSWHYGPDRALVILRADDAAENLDRERWRRLGVR